MNTTLVIMAAGMASRYGGNKQIDGMGPHNEVLMEYSICDALRAGFNKIVFIIRPDMRDRMHELFGEKLAKKAEVCYAYQDFSSLPAWFELPESRTKPFGTVHAVLCARDLIHEPFAVINADDYYGVDAFQKIHDQLLTMTGARDAAMVGYLLKNTVSKNGSVTRGICTVENGKLAAVREVQMIRLLDDGSIADTSEDGISVPLDPDALVSMNFWGFHHGIFDAMQAEFDAFLQSLAPDQIKAEYPLPVMIDGLLKSGQLEVSMLETNAVWFGVTYKEDRPLVMEALKELHEAGVYPDSLL